MNTGNAAADGAEGHSRNSHVDRQTHKWWRREERGWILSRELGSTNEIETREILTTNTTIYTTAKVPLP